MKKNEDRKMQGQTGKKVPANITGKKKYVRPQLIEYGNVYKLKAMVDMSKKKEE